MKFTNWAAYRAVEHHAEKQRAVDELSRTRTVTRLSQVEKEYQALYVLQAGQDDERKRTAERRLTMLMAVFIGLSILVLAAEIEMHPPANHTGVWLILETVLIFVFCLEIILRMYLEGKHWVRNVWSWFDVALVLQSFVTTWVLPMVDKSNRELNLLGLLRIARLARIIRLAKLIASSRQLYVIMMAWWSAFQGILYMYALLIVGIFLYAIVGTQLIGHNESLQNVLLASGTAKTAFGSTVSSMFTLFQLMTLQGFEGTTRPLVSESPLLLLYFGSFVLLFTFGLINMLVGLTVERTLHEAQRLQQESVEETPEDVSATIATLKNVFEECDAHGVGIITLPQFLQTVHENKAIREALDSLGLPTDDLNSIFNIADWDGDGHVGYQEFVVGVSKLRRLSCEFSAVAAHAGVRAVQRSLDGIIKNQESLRQQVARLASGQAKLASGQAAMANRLQNARVYAEELQTAGMLNAHACGEAAPAKRMRNARACGQEIQVEAMGNPYVYGGESSETGTVKPVLDSEHAVSNLQTDALDDFCRKFDSIPHRFADPVDSGYNASESANTLLRAEGLAHANVRDCLDGIITALREHTSKSSALAESQTRILSRLELILQQTRHPLSQARGDHTADLLAVAKATASPSDAPARPPANKMPFIAMGIRAEDAGDWDQDDAGTRAPCHDTSRSKVHL